MCILADAGHNFSIALISPNHGALIQLCGHLEIEGEMNYKDMCNDPELQAEVIKAIGEHGLRAGLKKSEIPRKIKLCFEPWTPESGLVTSTLTVRRDKMVEMYKKDINRMFGITDHNRNVFEMTPSNQTTNSRNGGGGANGGNNQETRVQVELERIEEGEERTIINDTNQVKVEMSSNGGNGNNRMKNRTESVEEDDEWKEAETEQSYM